VAAALQVQQQDVQAAGARAERRLDQQPGSAAEAQAAQRVVVELDGAPERDLRAGADLDGDLLLEQASVQLLRGALDDRGVVAKAPLTCGVATSVRVPTAAASRTSATDSSIVDGPSSMPGSTWQWRSITLDTVGAARAPERRSGAGGLGRAAAVQQRDARRVE
jgi:hypothetical protein